MSQFVFVQATGRKQGVLPRKVLIISLGTSRKLVFLHAKLWAGHFETGANLSSVSHRVRDLDYVRYCEVRVFMRQ